MVAIPEFLQSSDTSIVRDRLVTEAVPGHGIVGRSVCLRRQQM